MRPSFSGRLGLYFFAALVLTAAIAAAVTAVAPSPLLVFLGTLLFGLPLGLLLLQRFARPVNRLLQALINGVQSYRDKDFSVRLAAPHNDELGELVQVYNDMGDVFRGERREIYQRELLLETVLQSSPTAVVLTNARGRVVYVNRAAQELLCPEHRPNGMLFTEVLHGSPPGLRRAIANRTDSLFTAELKDGQETFHLAQRQFKLNTQSHTLYLINRLTRELARQEATTWKEIIRLINHELNNALAPISSLLHSARQLLDKPDHENALRHVFETMESTTSHLLRFLDDYGTFARLSSPQKEWVAWSPFLEQLRSLMTFELDMQVTRDEAYFDPAQMQQALLNLLKNAKEASPDDTTAVTLTLSNTANAGALVRVIDRGKGMPAEALAKALLPFYSTKASGTGLGLPLCREILEAHGGTMRLQPREGGGLVVSCWLPPGPPSANRAAPSE